MGYILDISLLCISIDTRGMTSQVAGKEAQEIGRISELGARSRYEMLCDRIIQAAPAQEVSSHFRAQPHHM